MRGTTTSRVVDHARESARQQVQIRALEAAVALEQRRREQMEVKYARLKRKYVRLERAFATLQERIGADEARFRPSPTSSQGSAASAESPTSPTRQDTEDDAVIDLTSPVASRRTSLASPASRVTQRMHGSEDIIAESPSTPNDITTTGSATRRSARLAASRSPTEPPPAAPVASARISGVRRRHLDFQMPDAVARPRPRLGPTDTDERTTPTRRRTEMVDTGERRSRRSPSQEESKSETETDRNHTGVDSDEAASIALAQYLQQQENMAAMEEAQQRLRALEYEHERRNHQLFHHLNHPVDQHPSEETPRAGLRDGAVDPDNMTYEELLQLGEEVGDVKKERWRQVAVQVLSRLPTHRWTTNSSDDISCIICQYGFSVGDVALTLPCAHVFHEECVSGWVRENNSCPLCKLEIADV